MDNEFLSELLPIIIIFNNRIYKNLYLILFCINRYFIKKLITKTLQSNIDYQMFHYARYIWS